MSRLLRYRRAKVSASSPLLLREGETVVSYGRGQHGGWLALILVSTEDIDDD